MNAFQLHLIHILKEIFLRYPTLSENRNLKGLGFNYNANTRVSQKFCRFKKKGQSIFSSIHTGQFLPHTNTYRNRRLFYKQSTVGDFPIKTQKSISNISTKNQYLRDEGFKDNQKKFTDIPYNSIKLYPSSTSHHIIKVSSRLSLVKLELVWTMYYHNQDIQIGSTFTLVRHKGNLCGTLGKWRLCSWNKEKNTCPVSLP